MDFRQRIIKKENLNFFLISIAIWFLLLIGLDKFPSLWFDEAWSLMVAKNWVQNGVYGRLLVDEFISAAGMAQPFTSTAWVALSFKLLGVGIWQARLPFTILTAGAIFFLLKMAQSLFGKYVAYFAILSLIIFTFPNYQLLLYGRQAIAEAPLIFYFLVGYYFLSKSFRNPKYLIGVIAFWGFAYNAKGLISPFLTIGLVGPMIIAAIRKNWKVLRLFAISLIGAIIFSLSISGFEIYLERGLATHGALTDLIRTVAFVGEFAVRRQTISYLLLFCLLSVISILWESKFIYQAVVNSEKLGEKEYIRISLFGIVSSWLIWFALLSNGWPRYYSPVIFLSSIFLGNLICKGIGTIKNLDKKTSFKILLSIPILFYFSFLIQNSFEFAVNSIKEQEIIHRDFEEIIGYLNSNTVPENIIETYDAEILFLANNISHFPPDNIQIELNKRAFLFEDILIDYELSGIDHDYIVIGRLGRRWNLYGPMVTNGEYVKVFDTESYEIYQRNN